MRGAPKSALVVHYSSHTATAGNALTIHAGIALRTSFLNLSAVTQDNIPPHPRPSKKPISHDKNPSP
jgi:hypothetical protein